MSRPLTSGERRTAPLYSLFRRQGNSWVRCSPLAFPLKQAREIFSPALKGAITREWPMMLLRKLSKAELDVAAATALSDYDTHRGACN